MSRGIVGFTDFILFFSEVYRKLVLLVHFIKSYFYLLLIVFLGLHVKSDRTNSCSANQWELNLTTKFFQTQNIVI